MTTRHALDVIAHAGPRWRQWFAAVWTYAAFLVLWAVSAAADDSPVPDFAWAWVWWPLQIAGWVLAATFVTAALAWDALGAWSRIVTAAGRALPCGKRRRHPHAP